MAKFDGEFEKQPGAKKQVKHNFAAEMEVDEVIQTRSVTAVKVSDGTDATADVLVPGSVSITDKKVLYGAGGGVTGERYIFTVRATSNKSIGTSDNHTMEREHLMIVKER